MKRLYALLVCLLAMICLVSAAPTEPIFSTEDEPVWCYIQFNTGSYVVGAPSTGGTLVTYSKSKLTARLWQLIGTKDNFILKTKSGRYAQWNSSTERYVSTTSAADATPLRLQASGNFWEITRQGSTLGWNMFGGAKVGAEIGEWTQGDTGNQLSFVLVDPVKPKFCTAEDENPQWYFIQFKNGLGVIADQGAGELAKVASVDPADSKLWKLVGTAESFQIVNKLGRYLIYSNVSAGATEMSPGPACANPIRTSATADEGSTFSLQATTNATYSPAWEIHPLNEAKSNYNINQWGGAAIGNSMGTWTLGDPNNPLDFIDPATVEYNDYTVTGVTSWSPESKLTLWYDQPATTTGVANPWMEYSLPIGNGQFGASLFGGVYKDEIQFNEKTLWTGTPNDYQSHAAGYGQYKNFGSVIVKDVSDGVFGFGEEKPAADYVRFLDIETATAGVDFKDAQGTQYSRRYVASNPDGVVAVHYTATGANKLNLLVSLNPGEGINASDVSYAEGDAKFSGQLATVKYAAQLRVSAADGSVESGSDGIRVKDATDVTFYLCGATDYDSSKASFSSGKNPADSVASRIGAAAEKGWAQVYADHKADFQSLMGRVKLQLGNANSTVNTEQLIKDYATSGATGDEALFLEQLYFAYGRYLEISSSRGIDVPANLQGIWNNLSNAPWNSDIHSNINVQMNYWPAEPTNLSEIHLPFLNYIINRAQGANWQKAATQAGQKYGWTCLTENNIFGGMSTWGDNYLVANAWYCSHLWQHYRYTLDEEFLKKAFPVMWSAAQFWMDRMIEDRVNEDGTYVCPDEYSPEQDAHNKEDGTAHAQQLVNSLFSSVSKAINILGQNTVGLSDADVAQLNDYLKKSDSGLHTEAFEGGTWASWGAQNGISVGDSLLKEWKYSPYSVSNDMGHRHMSHLMCLYPLDQVSKGSPYFTPAVNSLKLRGDAATGWSMGWKVNLWARALDGDHARTIIKNALRHSTSYATDQSKGGVYYNLYDAHAPFQIDGNFGVCAGIAEMLLQSQTDTIQILPALPSAWTSGRVTGLKAIGNFTVDITWANGAPTKVSITSHKGQPLVVGAKDIVGKKVSVSGVEVKAEQVGDGVVKINLAQDQTAEIDFTQNATSISALEQDPKSAGISVEGRKVTVLDQNIKHVQVSSVAGATLLQTACHTFQLSPEAGNVVLVTVTSEDGSSHTYKALLK